MWLPERYRRLRAIVSAFEYLNIFILLSSVVVAALLWYTRAFELLWGNLGVTSYAAALFAGIFYASSFTAAPATVALYQLGRIFDPLTVSVLGGVGAMLGDYVIFRYIRSNLLREFKALLRRFPRLYIRLSAFRRHRALVPLLPLLAGIILMSPFPDEIAMAILSASRASDEEMLSLSFVLNTLGIFLIVGLGFLKR